MDSPVTTPSWSSAIARLVLISAVLASSAVCEPQNLVAKLEKERVAVTVDGKLLTHYKFADSQKYPYFWPVNGPSSGRSITTETSQPYPHHHSLFFGCDRVNGANYWQGPNMVGQIISQGPKIEKDAGQEVVFTDECLWKLPVGAPVIRDTRRIVIAAPTDTLRLIDFEITLHPLTDIRIEKTNHSLFSGRVVPELSVKSGGTLVNAEGKKNESGTFGVNSPWCDYFGQRDGVTEGLAIFQHPGNRWYPSKWFTRDYGFFSPTPMYWPEAGHTQLPKGKPLTLRYRVVVHSGDTEAAGIAALFRAYAGSAAADQLEEDLGALKTYQIGQSRRPLIRITDACRNTHGSPEQRKALEARLAAILKTDAGLAGKQFVCQCLSEIGTEQSVSAIAELLTDEKLSNDARFALERIQSPSAGEALLRALAGLKGDLKTGVINSLAARGETGAVDALGELAGTGDAAVAAAAISALGRIGGQRAEKLLAGLKVPDELRGVKADARLLCADKMLEAGQADSATAVYHSLAAKDNAALVRIAALEGLVRSQGADSAPTILEFLTDENPQLQLAAGGFAARIQGEAATRAFAAELPRLPPKAQVVLIRTLAARGDKSAAPAVAGAAESTDEDVRIAAIQALGTLGDASYVSLLLKSAAKGGTTGKAAAGSLLSLPGDEVNAAMVEAMMDADPNTRVVIIRSLVERGYEGAAPVLLESMDKLAPEAHKAAGKALGALAGPEHLPRMVSLLLAAGKADQRRSLHQAICGLVARNKDAALSAPVIEGLTKASDEAKIDLLDILRRIADAHALAATRTQLKSKNDAVRQAAIRAMADWPNADPMEDLLRIAENTKNDAHQVLALRGYVKQVTMASERSAEETAGLLGKAMKLARRPEEKKVILSVLPRYVCDESLELAEAYAGDKDVAEEAKLALEQIRRREGPKFDFQLAGAPVMEDFTEVNAATAYSDARGYGWSAKPRAERDRKAGTRLSRDFIFDSAPRTFRVKVPNGSHSVTVFLGDMTNAHDNMQVRAEGEVKLKNVTNRAGEVKELFFDVEVKDGVLDIEFRDAGGRDSNWTCAGLIVGKKRTK